MNIKEKCEEHLHKLLQLKNNTVELMIQQKKLINDLQNDLRVTLKEIDELDEEIKETQEFINNFIYKERRAQNEEEQ